MAAFEIGLSWLVNLATLVGCLHLNLMLSCLFKREGSSGLQIGQMTVFYLPWVCSGQNSCTQSVGLIDCVLVFIPSDLSVS